MAYAEGHRHYHNSVHIAECLREFDAARHLAQHAEEVELAIWFHDAVYDPKAQDNEERSAELGRECVSRARLGNGLEHSVAQLILATKHHDITIAPDAPLLVDIDLSIFGQAEIRFFEYETQIRQEYSWVPVTVFRTKRAEILEAFLDRPRLYATDWFRHKYEQQARRNLLSSLRKLNNLNA
jgi:predicted metal-dependent HD superfamily phosphohydrolase